MHSQARRTDPAESDSLSCGLVFRRRLLSTPPHGDAVIFGYTVMTFCDKDFHLANRASSRTHERGRPARERPGWPRSQGGGIGLPGKAWCFGWSSTKKLMNPLQ